MKETVEPIRDDEIDFMFKTDLRSNLEEQILDTDIGKRVAAYEKMGIKEFSLKKLIDLYSENEGYSFSKTGAIQIDLDTLNTLIAPDVKAANERLGFDILSTDDNRLRKMIDLQGRISAEEYSRLVEDGQVNSIKAENIITEKIESSKADFSKVLKSFEENKKIVSELCKDTGYVQPSDFDKFFKLFDENAFNENAKEVKTKYEKDLKDTFITDEVDSSMIQFLYVIEKRPENFDKVMQDFMGKLKKSKFYEYLKDEEGNITLESVRKFRGEFEEKRNNIKTIEDITECHQMDETDLYDIENSEKIVSAILRASKHENPSVQNAAKELAKKIGADVFDGKEFDEKKLKEWAQRKVDISREKQGKPPITLEKLVKEDEWSKETGSKFIKRIKNALRYGRISLEEVKSVDDMVKFKNDSKMDKERVCSKKEKVVFDVLNSHNAIQIGKNHYSKKANALNVIALYSKYKEEENINSKESGFKDVEKTSDIIIKYMQRNREYFKEYLNEDGTVKQEAIDESMQGNKAMRLTKKTNYTVDYLQIERRTSRMMEQEEKYGDKLLSLGIEINTVLKYPKGSDRRDEINALFEKLGEVPKDVYSTEMLKNLKKIDEKKYEEHFGKDADRSVYKNNASSIYFSAARFFSRVYVMPSLVLKSKTVQNILPQILKNNKDQDNLKEETAIKKVSIFDKIRQKLFNKKENEKEESKEPIEEDIKGKQPDKKTDNFSNTYKVNVNVQDAVKTMKSENGKQVNENQMQQESQEEEDRA